MKRKFSFNSNSLRRIFLFIAKQNADVYKDLIGDALDAFEINTIDRAALFLSNLSLFSSDFRILDREYNEKIDKISGNRNEDDRKKYRQRGLFPFSGRYMYEWASERFNIDFKKDPDSVLEPKNMVMIAAWMWRTKGLNDLADKKMGKIDDISKRIYKSWRKVFSGGSSKDSYRRIRSILFSIPTVQRS